MIVPNYIKKYWILVVTCITLKMDADRGERLKFCGGQNYTYGKDNWGWTKDQKKEACATLCGGAGELNKGTN